jgi:hypothetical protein
MKPDKRVATLLLVTKLPSYDRYILQLDPASFFEEFEQVLVDRVHLQVG